MTGKRDNREDTWTMPLGWMIQRLRRERWLLVCVAAVGITVCFGGGFMKRGSSAMGHGKEMQQDRMNGRIRAGAVVTSEPTGTPEAAKALAEKISLKSQYASKKAGTVVKTAGSSKKEQRSMFYKSKLTKKVFQRMKGKSYGNGCTVPKGDLRYLRMLHVGFDGKAHIGEMVVNKKIADDVLVIFYRLYQKKYPIQRMVLVDEYNANDDKSMAANNTSCFNYRAVKGTTNLSKHSYGLAIDVNPLYNPYIHTMNGRVVCEPKGSKKYSDRSKDFPYKITRKDSCFKLFTKYGFTWGGDWNTKKDYQHFQKS